MKAHLAPRMISLTLLAAVTTACTTTTGVATDATATGDGSALAKEGHADLGKGQLIGTGVGAAAGAVYDVRKRDSR
jgi:hypothetical protein